MRSSCLCSATSRSYDKYHFGQTSLNGRQAGICSKLLIPCRISYNVTKPEENEREMANVQHVNKEEWQKLQSDAKPTFVDFWATWCGPCRMISPTFEKLAEMYSKEINFAKVNVDEEPELAGQFGIRSIPSLLLIKDGKVVEQVVGARPYEELAKVLEAH